MTTTIERAPRIYETSIGKKILVAVTGLVFLGFVFAHMVGNLKIFLGPTQVNKYGEFLRDMGEPIFPRSFLLWGLRLVLFVCLVLHVSLTIQLARRSRASRTTRYVHTDVVQASYASRTMRWGGLAIFLFLIFHLADFTWGIHPHYVRGDIYANTVSGFERPAVVILYLMAMGALALHIYHGTWSTCQTLGIKRARWDPVIRRTATALAVIIAGGFSAVPLAVAFGLVR
ncbi:MAG: succinate dehydrogenase / fumarate reductase, cytochrome b subunit [Actinomycetota bacterium]|jgi:succinate dehydrogenase / fumarate reductase cytochrome b subunit|nr:succinate dehydrogenase / fumarate reductase, cytochrome b subunit [Actinomycetota bacterium]